MAFPDLIRAAERAASLGDAIVGARRIPQAAGACSAFAKVIAEIDRVFSVEPYGFFCINFPASFSI